MMVVHRPALMVTLPLNTLLDDVTLIQSVLLLKLVLVVCFM